jgi:hypothetical protein
MLLINGKGSKGSIKRVLLKGFMPRLSDWNFQLSKVRIQTRGAIEHISFLSYAFLQSTWKVRLYLGFKHYVLTMVFLLVMNFVEPFKHDFRKIHNKKENAFLASSHANA